MAEDRISSIIDLESVKAEVTATKTEIKDLVSLIQSVKKKDIQISTSKSLAEFNNLKRELDLLTKQTDAAAKAAIAEAKAREANSKATIAETRAAELLAKQKLAEIKLREANQKVTERERIAAEKLAEAKALEEKTQLDQAERLKLVELKAEEQTATVALTQSLEDQAAAQAELNAAIASAATSGNQRAQLVSGAAPEVAQGVAVYRDELEKLTGTLEENQKLHGIYQTELAGVNNEIRILEKSTDASAKGSKKYQDELGRLKGRQAELKTEIKDVSRTIGLQVKENTNAAGSINQLRARYALLVQEIERGGTVFKKTAIGKSLQAEAIQVKVALDKAERDIGFFRGSASNIGTAVLDTGKKLFSFVRIAANVIPGLGLGGAFLAIFEGLKFIANTLGLFNDKTTAAEKATKAFNEAQKESSDEIGRSVGEIQALYKITQDVTQSTEDRKDATQRLLEINKENNEKTGAHTELLIDQNGILKINSEAIDTLTESLIRQAKTKAFLSVIEKAYADLVKAQTSTIESQSNKIEKVLSKITGFTGLGVGTAREAKKFQEGVDNAQNYLNEVTNLFQKKIQSGELDLSGVFDKKKTEKAKKETQSELFKFLEEQRKAQFEQQKRILQDKIDADTELLNNDKAFFNRRLEAAQGFYNYSLKLIEAQKKFDLEGVDTKATEDKRKAIEEIKNKTELQKTLNAIDATALEQKKLIEINSNSAITKLNSDSEKQITSLIDNNLKKRQALRQQAAKEELEHEKSVHENELEVIKNRYDEDVNAENESYLKKIKAARDNKEKLNAVEKQHNKNLLDLQLDFQIKALTEDIKFTKETLALAEARAALTGKQEDIDAVITAKTKLHALEIELQKDITDHALKSDKIETESDDEKTAKRIANLERYSNHAKELFSIIADFASIAAEREKNAIQEQIDLLDAKKAKDIEVANQTIVNATDRANAIDVIEKRADAQKQILERRQRQADERKARFDKAANIAAIIQETALAVIRALGDRALPGPARIVEAVVIGALGAARLAVAIATPIPKYGKGTFYHKGGLMEVGDAGKAEGVQLPDGTILKTPATSTIIEAPTGTKVYPDFDKMMFTATMTKTPIFKVKTLSNDETLKKVGKDIVRAIKAQPLPVFKGEAPYKKFFKRGSTWSEYIDRNL